jgi:hypothetical protein
VQSSLVVLVLVIVVLRPRRLWHDSGTSVGIDVYDKKEDQNNNKVVSQNNNSLFFKEREGEMMIIFYYSNLRIQ